MNKIFLIALFVFLPFFQVSSLPSKETQWVETVGEITAAEEVEDGQVEYNLVYVVEESQSNAVNQAGKKISGKMQHSICPPSKYKGLIPLVPQKIKIKFERDEPIFWEYLEDIKWKKINTSKSS